MKFRSTPASIRGSIAPVVTPFTADGEVDHDSLRRLIRWQIDSGSHGISLGGSTGEPSAQTSPSGIAAMRGRRRGGRRPGAVPARHGLGQARRDARAHRGRPASSAPMPRWSSRRTTRARRRTGCTSGTPPSPRRSPTCRSCSTTCRSAPRSTSPRRPSPGCAATTPTSSASRRRPRTSSTSPGCSSCAGATPWCGRASSCCACRCSTLGGIGFVSAVANLAPSAVASMYDLLVGGDTDKALDIHYGLHPLVDLMFVETNPAPIKGARPGRPDRLRAVRPPLVDSRPPDRRASSSCWRAVRSR